MLTLLCNIHVMTMPFTLDLKARSLFFLDHVTFLLYGNCLGCCYCGVVTIHTRFIQQSWPI